MSEEALKIISDDMAALGINYALLEWKGKLVYPYFIGEYQEVPTPNEDGEEETSFILTGFSRGQHLELERAKKKIKKIYPKDGRLVTVDGITVAIFYESGSPVPIGDGEFKRIQINLTIKEWSVN